MICRVGKAKRAHAFGEAESDAWARFALPTLQLIDAQEFGDETLLDHGLATELG